ncbi:hypothetical protein MNBD_ALPHA01-1744 [hydrothermal vent metagenome]|uniref:Uncharacterized protein n=1 Tax=hydrothermal vent metagenome TaxID=652676 RepID=A0A3B0SAS1_9ZZZZ
MFIYNPLGRIRYVITGVALLLMACSGGDKGSSALLNADDMWDRMAEERQKPFPAMEESDSGEIPEQLPAASSPAPLSADDVEQYRETLRSADKKYQHVMASLERGFDDLLQAIATDGDRQAEWRTMQLHLSRLISLQKDVTQALTALKSGDEDPSQLAKARDLQVKIPKSIAETQNRLNEFIS